MTTPSGTAELKPSEEQEMTEVPRTPKDPKDRRTSVERTAAALTVGMYAILEHDPRFQEADLEKAKENLLATSITEDGQWINPCKAHLETHVADLGIGMHLYFSIIRQIGYVLLALVILSIPIFIFDRTGNMIDAQTAYGFDSTHIYNIGNHPNISFGLSQWESAQALMHRYIRFADRSIKDMAAVTTALGFLDFLMILVVLGWSIWFLRWFTDTVKEKNDASTTTMRDYSVEVTHLPPMLPTLERHEAYAEELKSHFEGLQGGTIVEVILVRDMNGQLDDFLKCGQLRFELQLIEARRRLGVEGWACTEEGKMEEYNAKLVSLLKEYEPLNELPVIKAFIVFKEGMDKEKIINTYKMSWLSVKTGIQPRTLRFNNKVIHVRDAPAPEDLIWENLDFPPRRRKLRICLTTLITILLLIIALFIFAIAESWLTPNLPEAPTTAAIFGVSSYLIPGNSWTICDLQFYSGYAASGGISTTETALYIDGVPTMELDLIAGPNCWTSSTSGVVGVLADPGSESEARSVTFDSSGSGNHFDILMCDESGAPDPGIVPPVCTIAASMGAVPGATQQYDLYEFNEESLTDCEATNAGDMSMDEFGDYRAGSSGDSQEWYSNCWCTANLGLVFSDSTARELCKDTIRDLLIGATRELVVAGLMTVMNMVLQTALTYLVPFERPMSVTDRMRSIFVKIYAALYLNMVLLVVVLHARIFNTPLAIGSVQITGSYADINPDWYRTAGNRLSWNSLFMIFYPLLNLVYIPLNWVMRWDCFTKGKVTQHDLDTAYTNPEFPIAIRYANFMAMFSVTLTFSSGMPVMLMFGLLAVVSIYWVDKWHLFWGCRRPPQYSDALNPTAVMMVTATVLLHCIFAQSMMGNPVVFPSNHIGSWANDYVRELSASLEEIGRPFNYFYHTPDGFFSHLFFPRIAANFANTATIWHFLVVLIMILMLCAALGIVIALACGYQPSRMVVTRVLPALTGKPNPHIEERPFEEGKLLIEENGLPSSYDITKNPYYADATSFITELRALRKKRDMKKQQGLDDESDDDSAVNAATMMDSIQSKPTVFIGTK